MLAMSMILRTVCAAFLIGKGSTILLGRSSHREAISDNNEDVRSDNPLDYTMDDALRVLWYGYDIGHELQGILARAPRTRYYLRQLRIDNFTRNENKDSPKLIILGPKDSGVSLLVELLEINYWNELKQACDWEDLWIDHDRPWKGHLFCRIWSRGLRVSDAVYADSAEALYSVLQTQGTDPAETVVLMMVKSPLATMLSWNTAIRERTSCMKRPALEWNTPCSAEDVAWTQDGNRDRRDSFEVASTMELYNKYMTMFHTIKQDGKFLKAHFVTYEDLVEDPADTVLTIAGAMNWKPLGDIEVQEGLSANGFPAAGRPLMVEELRTRTWLGWIPVQTRALWCGSLDSNIFRDLAENTFRLDEFPFVTYDLDCR